MSAEVVFNNIINQYETAISSMTVFNLLLAKETYYKLALITVAVALINHFLRTQVDAAEANVEFVKTIITLYFFFFLISSYTEWLPLIGQTFKNIGFQLASNVSKTAGVDYIKNPGGIVSLGLHLGEKVLGFGMHLFSFRNIGLTIVSVLCAAWIIYSFARIAVEVLLIDIGSRIILGVGVFMLGFGGSPWTRNYAEKYISAMFNLGIKMLFIYALVGIGCNITNDWIDKMIKGGSGDFLGNILAMAAATYVYYMICLKVPDMAATLLSGQVSPGFGSGDANIRSIMAGTGAVAMGIGAKAVGMVGGMSAVKQAWQTASSKMGSTPQDASSSKKVMDGLGKGFGTAGGAVKTLGTAAAFRTKEKVAGALNNTSGGRLSNIIKYGVSTPPKPEPPSNPVVPSKSNSTSKRKKNK
ncbi:MAG: P-type conjugative transfer protein TrbL [Candidatus Omnitrophota bacterium]